MRPMMLCALAGLVAASLPLHAQTPPPSGFLVPFDHDDDFEETVPAQPARTEPAPAPRREAPKEKKKPSSQTTRKAAEAFDDVPAGFVVFEVESDPAFAETPGAQPPADDDVPPGWLMVDATDDPLDLPLAEPEKAPEARPEVTGMGIGLTAGVGALLPMDSRSGYTGAFAYGLQASLALGLLDGLHLDVGAWRGAISDGTPVSQVTTTFNNLSVRALYLHRFERQPNLFVGGGAGPLASLGQVDYRLVDEGEDAFGMVSFRPGLDAGLVCGAQLDQLQVRVDVRSMMRGLSRLDFLATVSAGAAF